MNGLKVPGIIYSLLLAVLGWAATYFATGGAGGDYLWAPIVLAGLPIVLKFVTVYAGDKEQPAAMTRGMGNPVPRVSKTERLLLG